MLKLSVVRLYLINLLPYVPVKTLFLQFDKFSCLHHVYIICLMCRTQLIYFMVL